MARSLPGMFDLVGRRALVTGGSKGIGLGAATVLAQAGCEVTIVARDRAGIHAAVARIAGEGGKVAGVELDVADPLAVRGFVDAAPPFHILVNNAGTNRPGPFLDCTTENFDAVMSLNVRSTFFVAQSVARRLVEAGEKGSIINLSSQMGHVGAVNRTVYCASKWAVEGLTRAMALELAPHGIRVNTLAPTFIETPMTAPFFADPQFRTQTLAKIKLGRVGTVDDLAGAFLFLASDASSLMTGASLVIDGGWTAD